MSFSLSLSRTNTHSEMNEARLTIVESVALRTDQTDPEKLAIIYAIAKATDWNADHAIKNIEEGTFLLQSINEVSNHVL
jgi:hypothetical protein